MPGASGRKFVVARARDRELGTGSRVRENESVLTGIVLECQVPVGSVSTTSEQVPVYHSGPDLTSKVSVRRPTSSEGPLTVGRHRESPSMNAHVSRPVCVSGGSGHEPRDMCRALRLCVGVSRHVDPYTIVCTRVYERVYVCAWTDRREVVKSLRL